MLETGFITCYPPTAETAINSFRCYYQVSETGCNSFFGVGVATCFCLPTAPNLFLAINRTT